MKRLTYTIKVRQLKRLMSHYRLSGQRKLVIYFKVDCSLDRTECRGAIYKCVDLYRLVETAMSVIERPRSGGLVYCNLANTLIGKYCIINAYAMNCSIVSDGYVGPSSLYIVS